LEGDLGLEGGVLVTGINAFLRPESNSVGTLISVFILYGILLQDPEQTRTFLKRKDKTYH
jgi:hypothetical protein